VLGSVCCLTLGATPAAGYQREVQAAADTLGEKLAGAGKRSVAVVDFTDLQGEVTELGRFLAEEMSVALASSSRPLEVVDRTHLKTLIQEHKLSATGLIDPATAKKLGQIAGVDALVTGTLTPFGDTVRLTLKVLDTSTARIVAATTAEIAKTKAIEELVAQGVGDIGLPAESDKRLPAPAGLPKPVEWEGLRFTLKRCLSTGGGVRCEMLVDNLTEVAIHLLVASRGLPGWRGGSPGVSTSLYDNSGNQYSGAEVTLGGAAARSGGVVEVVVHPGVPLVASLTFRGLPTDLSTVSLAVLLEAGRRTQLILFRGVPLTR
jgi:TolB-like protein